MRIIKLDAIDSTNNYLREMSALESLLDYTVVVAEKQTQGRGQMGAVWDSEPSKNLTFSVFKNISGLNLEASYSISMITALAILKSLQDLAIPKLSIKWPNDILSEDKKICGILIENVIKEASLNASILGVGLNVNQRVFKNLPRASSLKLLSGKNYILDEVLISIVENLKQYFHIYETGNFDVLKEAYVANLFRINKPSTFKDQSGLMFSGFISGISNTGNLQVLIEDNITKEFDLKEITLMY